MSWFSSKRASPAEAPVGAHGHALFNDRYRLGAVLGEGAGGQVREAIDLRTGATVAIKLLQLPPAMPQRQRQEWLLRLQREAALAQRLTHPDIVAVHAAGLAGQQAWLVMERVRGVDLSRYTQPNRLLPENLVLRIGARVAAALAHAHAQGVIHRDLKPTNVMVNLAGGQLKLADFGVAQDADAEPTRTGMALGTPAYMAPEQLAGAAASPASDAYALGVMLFELLTGRRPHQADTLGALLKTTLSQPPAALAELRPDLPAPAAAAVMRLLTRDPNERPANLAVWAVDVAALAALMTRLLAPAASPVL